MHEREPIDDWSGAGGRPEHPARLGFAYGRPRDSLSLRAIAALALALCAPPAPAAAPPAAAELAREARALEDLGAYGQAADLLRRLRPQVPADADLDLALAVNLARAGEADSAAALLWGPTLSSALLDTLPVGRRQSYAWHREPLWLNGRFDGWHWYVARARAEVAARRGRWDLALEAARACVAARPQSGVEWHVLALAAGRSGDRAGAEAAARRAVLLDPALPEALHLLGLLEWRAGRRGPAQDLFRRAVGLDSLYREPALAALRVRLPGAPDSLPARLLGGERAAALLTTPEHPKPEEFVQMETPALMVRGARPVLPDSLRAGPVRITTIVLVDERGRVVAHELPWLPPGDVPDAVVGHLVRTLPEWRFQPATRHGVPSRVWVSIDLEYVP
jgi:tetratricopeptide (TPR) repeat protein